MSSEPPGELKSLISLGVSGIQATKESWNTVVGSAVGLLRDLLAPLTAATTGLGQIIRTRLDGMNEAEKVLAAKAVWEAQETLKTKGKAVRAEADPEVLLQVLQGAGSTANPTLHECWKNLLEKHLADDDVHPELLLFLKRLSPDDARLLVVVSKLKLATRSLRERREDLAKLVGRTFHKFNVDIITLIDFSGVTAGSYLEWAAREKARLLEMTLPKKSKVEDSSLTSFFRNREGVLKVREYKMGLSTWEAELEENLALFAAVPEERRRFSIAVLSQLGIFTKDSNEQHSWEHVGFTFIGQKFVSAIMP